MTMAYAARDAVSRQDVAEWNDEMYRRPAFDVILSSEMLEHTTDPRAVLGRIHEVCGEETRVVLSAPLEAPKLVLGMHFVVRLRSAGTTPAGAL
jgi:2-polyprenyl-3-methyl-5-hydroxy-6-metoxy-1,4-benzoquinol methylase